MLKPEQEQLSAVRDDVLLVTWRLKNQPTWSFDSVLLQDDFESTALDHPLVNGTFDIAIVDVILITNVFDCAALPYITEVCCNHYNHALKTR